MESATSGAGPPPLPPRPTKSTAPPTASGPPPLPARRLVPPPPLSSQTLAAEPVEPRLVPALSDDVTYSLLRRWNRDVLSLHSAQVPEDRLDLYPSPEERFQPEKLRANIERFYLSIIVGITTFVKQIVLLRSWENPLRTGTFASAYYIAWSSRLGVGPCFFAVLAVIILHPGFRTFLFPPLPIVLSPASPSLDDPVVPAQEQEELDARDFAQGVADIASSSLRPENGNPQSPAAELTDAFDVSPSEEAAAEPAEEAKAKTDHLAKIGLPIQTIAGDLADAWERWANALAPTPPFPTYEARLKVAAVLLLIVLVLAVLPTAVVAHSVTFLLGGIFFGQPAIVMIGPALDSLLHGNWREALQIRYSLLNGVPSSSQLALRLLRDGEATNAPLPPPPPLMTRSRLPSPVMTRASTVESVGDFSAPDLERTSTAGSVSTSASKKKGGNKFASFVKIAAKVTEEGAGYVSGQKSVNWEKLSRAAVDQLKKTTGSELPEHFMMVVPSYKDEGDKSRSVFYATHRRVPGHLLLNLPTLEDLSIIPTLEFKKIGKSAPAVTLAADPAPEAKASGDTPAESPSPTTPKVEKKTANVSIPISSIVSLRRSAGLGWQGRALAGWMLSSDAHVGSGIDVRWKLEAGVEGGVEEEVSFSSVVRRDELFNRLASCGDQRWEML